MSTYSSNLKIELIATGDQSGVWGTTTNDNFSNVFEQSIVGRVTVSFSNADVTLTATNTVASQDYRNVYLNCTGTNAASRNLIVPTLNKNYIVENNTTGGFSIVVKTSAGTGITIPNGSKCAVYVDGTNVVQNDNYFPAAVFASITDSGLTSGRVTFASTSGLLADSANLTWDGSFLTAASIKDTALTSGRVTFAGASGLLSDSANLQFNGTKLGINKTPSAATPQLLQIKQPDAVYSGISIEKSDDDSYLGIGYWNSTSAWTFQPTYQSTGSYLPIAFATSGTERMRITSAGNVGVGIASPLYPVQVKQNGVGYSSGLAVTSQANDSSLFIYGTGSVFNILAGYESTGSYQPIAFNVSGAEGMRLTSTGLGIGTSSPLAKLDVVSGTNTTLSVPAGVISKFSGSITLNSLSTASSGNIDSIYFQKSHTSGINISNYELGIIKSFTGNGYTGGLDFFTGKNIGGGNYAATFAMRIDENQQVGIGTSSPLVNLDVVNSSAPGTGAVTTVRLNHAGTTAGDGPRLLFTSGTSTTGGCAIAGYGTALNEAAMLFYSGGNTERMRLDSSGNLGLGVTPNSSFSSSAYGALQLGQRGVLMFFKTGANVLNIGNNFYYDGSTYKRLTADYVTQYQQATGEFNWRIAGTGAADSTITFTQAMTLDASGRLGIGTISTLTARLESYTSSFNQSAFIATTTYTAGGSAATITVGSNDGNYSGGYGVKVFDKTSNGGGGQVGYGVYITSPYDGTNATGNTYALTKYGLYIDDIYSYYGVNNPTSNANWGIYVKGGANNYIAGNVGIGTSSPADTNNFGHALDIQGSTGSAAYFRDSDDTSKYGLAGFFGADSSGYFGTWGSDTKVLFYSSSTERMRITSGGYTKASNTGTYVNLTGTYHELQANNTNDYVVVVSNSNSTPAFEYIQDWRYTASTPNNGNARFWNCTDATADRAYMLSNGGLANYAANNVILSDSREKTNFAPSKSYLDVICAIPVQTFNYIDQNLIEDDGLTLGVTAQDVQAVAPELVSEGNWGTKDEPKMRLQIYQTDLQYALMKCIQEQQALIESLTTRLTALENK